MSLWILCVHCIVVGMEVCCGSERQECPLSALSNLVVGGLYLVGQVVRQGLHHALFCISYCFPSVLSELGAVSIGDYLFNINSEFQWQLASGHCPAQGLVGSSHFVQLIGLCQVHLFKSFCPLCRSPDWLSISGLLWTHLSGPISSVRIPNDSNSFLSTSTPAADAEEEDVAGGSVVSRRVVLNSAMSSNRSTEFEAELLLLPVPAQRLNTMRLIASPGCSSWLLLPDMSLSCNRSSK